jgi:hypothetical protein
MTVNLYQYTDSGAPNLASNAAGSLIDLLQACLVDGYGAGENAKAGAGWTLELESSNKAIFKNASGVYFKVKDDGAVRTDQTGKYNMATVTGALGYTDIDTLSTPFPRTVTGTNLHSTTWYGAPFIKYLGGDWGDQTDVPWIVVANDKTCYFMSQFDLGTGYWYPHVMGDLKLMANITNYPKSIVCGFDLRSSFGDLSESYTPMIVAGNSVSKYLAFPLSGGYESTKFHLCQTIATPYAGGYAGKTGAYHLYPSPITGGAILEPLYLTDDVSDGTEGGYEFNRFAKYAGFYSCAHKLDGSAYAIGSNGDTMTIDGKTYLLLLMRTYFSPYMTCAFAVDITGPW